MQKANLIISTSVHYVFGNVIEEQASPTLEEINDFANRRPLADYPLMAKSVRKSYEDILKGHDEFEDSLRLIIGHA